MKMIWFRFKFRRNFSQESKLQQARVGSDNGSAPKRRQAITLTSDGPVHLRIYAALGGDEF